MMEHDPANQRILSSSPYGTGRAADCGAMRWSSDAAQTGNRRNTTNGHWPEDNDQYEGASSREVLVDDKSDHNGHCKLAAGTGRGSNARGTARHGYGDEGKWKAGVL